MGGFLTALPLIGGVIKTVFGDRAAREAAEANANASTLSEFGAEFGYRDNRTWWDSLIDGLNRLPRPLLALGVFFVTFIWPALSPATFRDYVTAIAIVPEGFWAMSGVVVGFFFGGRMQMSSASFKMTKEQMGLAKELALSSGSKTDEEMQDEEYQKAMASTEPLSNEAILEWKRRHSP